MKLQWFHLPLPGIFLTKSHGSNEIYKQIVKKSKKQKKTDHIKNADLRILVSNASPLKSWINMAFHTQLLGFVANLPHRWVETLHNGKIQQIQIKTVCRSVDFWMLGMSQSGKWEHLIGVEVLTTLFEIYLTPRKAGAVWKCHPFLAKWRLLSSSKGFFKMNFSNDESLD